ncbi:MAG: ABC transporter ATP-binding protein [Selenomonas sp.]|uniref:ABC transporter ATP-binding protein n=1 Tax=Selenomonas sp. TaxID=2053611 RepID=UPI0025E474FE|nr:ABC transporter ATP-binding protein [Selenomonas sp.]MCR5757931.1 ABC transporter ATP-binding protein [Selenomonas sp.]
MIAIEDLAVVYQRAQQKHTALKNVSLTVPRGTVCAVIGPSGCGKSTLLKVTAGLIRDYSGQVRINGGEVSPQNLRIGFMPQNYGLLPWQTVADNIRLACRIKDGWTAEKTVKMQALCQKLGIEDLLGRYPQELSGGQQQRVSLARVFLLEPDILLMDEPFSALDAITREEMQDVFRDLWEEAGITTILVTHYVEEALYLGQQIVLMSAHPGTVAEVMVNKWQGSRAWKSSPEFFAKSQELKEKIKTMGARTL